MNTNSTLTVLCKWSTVNVPSDYYPDIVKCTKRHCCRKKKRQSAISLWLPAINHSHRKIVSKSAKNHPDMSSNRKAAKAEITQWFFFLLLAELCLHWTDGMFCTCISHISSLFRSAAYYSVSFPTLFLTVTSLFFTFSNTWLISFQLKPHSNFYIWRKLDLWNVILSLLLFCHPVSVLSHMRRALAWCPGQWASTSSFIFRNKCNKLK